MAGRYVGNTVNKITKSVETFASGSVTVMVTEPESSGLTLVDKRIAMLVLLVKVGTALDITGSVGITSQPVGEPATVTS